MFDRVAVGVLPEGSLAGLGEVSPGIVSAAALLTSVDVDRLSGHDTVVAVSAVQRLISHLEALRFAAMAALCDTVAAEEGIDDEQWAASIAASEIGAELRLTRRAADTEMALALELRRHPKLAEALRTGRLDVRRVRVIVESLAGVTSAVAAHVVDRVLDDAADMTTGQLRARLRRLVIDVDPDGAASRYRHAVQGRKVTVDADPSGTAHLYATDLEPHRAAAAMRRLTDLAYQLKTADEPRTIDQLRADCLVDLLCGQHPSGSGNATVDIRVDLTTLLGLDDQAADVAGYGPVIADIARRTIDHDDEWRFTVTDDTGAVVATGVTARRPTTAQRRHLEAVYRHCVFPGCRVPARRCDLDHTVAWAHGGPTTTCNLTPLCRHHHTLKHTTRWTYRRLRNGTHQWTSPHSHTYTSGTEP